jgi:hypothetical protein
VQARFKVLDLDFSGECIGELIVQEAGDGKEHEETGSHVELDVGDGLHE